MPTEADALDAAREARPLERAMFEMKRVIVGQDRLIERMMVSLLARGHCLLEGAPGLAKTLAVEQTSQAYSSNRSPRQRSSIP